MVDVNLGEYLYNTGWKQGVLIDALPWSVIYHPNEPLTRIAKKAKQQSDKEETKVTVSMYRVASGFHSEKERLVIISQDCDIVKKPNLIPTIFAMRAFVTDNEPILNVAAGNSTQYFLLNESRNLVADSTIIVPIEKPVLTNFAPELGVSSNSTKHLFAKWVAHCFNRPAFHDNIVKNIIGPILNNIRKMQEENDQDFAALTMVREIRIARLEDDPPYELNLVFIVPESGLPDKGVTLARFVNRMRQWFDPATTKLAAWDALNLYQISAGDYIDTDQIYLDHYTYRGETIMGLLPPLYTL